MDREREDSHLLVHSPNTHDDQSCSQQSGTPSGCPAWVVGTQPVSRKPELETEPGPELGYSSVGRGHLSRHATLPPRYPRHSDEELTVGVTGTELCTLEGYVRATVALRVT